MNLLTMTLAASSPVDHVVDKSVWSGGHDWPFYLSSDGSLWYISNATIMLVLAGIITCLVLIPAARRIATGKSGTLEDLRAKGITANIVEAICLYLRDYSFKPILGEQEADKHAPMLWTLFWFILICNLLGLVPILDVTGEVAQLTHLNHGHGIGGTATQSIWVTGGLALIAFLWYNGIAIGRDFKSWAMHLTAGTPWYLWPLMVPIEVIGTLVKPTALALRLCANMTGGHIIVATFLMFIGQLTKTEVLNPVAGYGLAVLPLLVTIAIYFLEIFVALLQAYIFMFLTCLFLGQLIHHDDHGDHHEHSEEHAVLDATQEGAEHRGHAAGAH